MAKKSMKEVATAGTSVFEQLTNNSASYGKDANDVQYVQDAKDTSDTKDIKTVKSAKDVKNTKATKKPQIKWERLNLRIPADVKEHLTVAAAKASIERKKPVSLTEYLCELVRADMEKDK